MKRELKKNKQKIVLHRRNAAATSVVFKMANFSLITVSGFRLPPLSLGFPFFVIFIFFSTLPPAAMAMDNAGVASFLSFVCLSPRFLLRSKSESGGAEPPLPPSAFPKIEA